MLTLASTQADARNISLVLIGGVHQDVSLSYGYDGAESGGGGSSSNSSQHSFDENYDIGFRYAIYNPMILHGNFQGGIRLNQESASGTSATTGSSSSHNFLYRLDGILLEKQPAPVNFFSYSELTRINRAFSPSYDLSSDGYGASISVQNRFIPISLTYSRSNSSTSGQGVDTDSTTETLSLNASHNYRNVCVTGVGITSSQAESHSIGLGVDTSSGSFGFNASNTMNFGGKDLQRQLRSRYYLFQETGTRIRDYAEVEEALTWEAGKALGLGATYNNRTETINGQSSKGNSGSVWLQHRLFQSLVTRLLAHVQETEFSNGKITSTGETIGFDYQKILPRESMLQLTYTFDHSITENELQSDVQPVTNERVTVPDIAPFEIQLENLDIVPNTIIVSTKDRTSHIYVEGSDYTVRQDGPFSYIVFGNLPTGPPFPIDRGTVLSVDYSFRVDPSVKYAATTHSAAASLLLFNNRHRIYARLSESNEEMLGGQGKGSRLSDTRLFTLGFATNLKFISYGAAYQTYETSWTKNNELDGYWRFARNFDGEYISLNLRERYNLREINAATSGSSNSNSFDATAVYQRVLFGRANMKFTGQFTDVRGVVALDQVILGLDMDTRFGKSQLALTALLGWSISEGTTSRNESLRLTYTRYF